jgi:trehalose 6-phosphate phosphatase
LRRGGGVRNQRPYITSMTHPRSTPAEAAVRLCVDSALFLDLDGTLIDLAPTPQSVSVPAGLVSILDRLHRSLRGALAILTGRSIQDLDGLLAPLRLPAAGQHGAEIRLARNAPIETATSAAVPDTWRDRLDALAREDSRVVVEDKGLTIAVHFRAAPEREPQIRGIAAELAALEPRFALQNGKCVIELRPYATDKGTALRRYMALPSFAGRRPIVLGDDLTDEPAFRAARSLGGYALPIGPVPRAAGISLSCPQIVRAWLAAGLESLAAAKVPS